MSWGNVHAKWVDRSFVHSQEHTTLIRQFMAAHCLCEASNPLVIVDGKEDVQEQYKNSALHWSRVFEWPWAIMHGKHGPGVLALDAGGGHGPFQHVLAPRVRTVFNVDKDQRSLDFAQVHPMNRGNLKCILGDITDLPFPNGFFDQVYCISVLEHIQDWWNVFQELLRVVKSGGRLVLTMDVMIRGIIKDEFFVTIKDAEEVVKFLGGTIPKPIGEAVSLNHMKTGEDLLCLCLCADKE